MGRRVVRVVATAGPCLACGRDTRCMALYSDDSRLVHHRALAAHPCHLPAPELPKGQSK